MTETKGTATVSVLSGSLERAEIGGVGQQMRKKKKQRNRTRIEEKESIPMIKQS